MPHIYETKLYNTSDKIPKISLYDLKTCLKRYQLKTTFQILLYIIIITFTFTFLVEKIGVTVFDKVSTNQ